MMAQQDWSTVGKPVRKKDAMAPSVGQARLSGRPRPRRTAWWSQRAAPTPTPSLRRSIRERRADPRRCRHLHLQGCATEAVHHGGTDLSELPPP